MTAVNTQANNPLLEQDSDIGYNQQNNINNDQIKVKQINDNDTCCHRHKKKIGCSWCCFGIILFILAVQTGILPSFLRTAVQQGLQEALIFTYVDYDDENFRNWANTKDANIPYFMEVRFFHVTNPWEVLHDGVYPIFEKMPVLVYNEIDVKLNISFSEDGEHAKWNAWTYYTLNDTRNELDPKTNLTVFSPYLGLIWAQKDWYPYLNDIEYEALIAGVNELNETEAMALLFWNATAEDLLFNIYNFNISLDLNYTGDCNSSYICNITELIYSGDPIYLLGNQTYEEAMDPKNIEVVNTGFWDNSRYMEIQSLGEFDGEYVDCWNPPAPIAPGHDDYFGPYSIKKDEDVLVFDSQVYKNTILQFNETVDFHGIELWKYTVQLMPQFLNASLAPQNAQWYQYGWSGVENLTTCQSIPIFVSFAEFLGAQDFINLNKYMGLDDNPSWDGQVYIDVEPHSGAILKANKTLQINTFIHNIPHAFHQNKSGPFSKLLTNVSNTHVEEEGLVVPVVMYSQYEEITADQAKDFKSLVIDTLNLADTMETLGYVCIGLLALYSMICCYCIGIKHAKSKINAENMY